MKTPLYDEHVRLSGKMVPFAGYSMPVQYATGILAEHRAVRESAGIFDVSHMGEFRVRGPGACHFVSRATINDPAALADGQAQYSAMCREDGGMVDDVLVYRMGEEDFRLVVNAANIQKDWDWLKSLDPGAGADMQDESDDVALIALQGPAAAEMLAGLTDTPLGDIRYYAFAQGAVAGAACVISRTGYTGEDGFELYLGSGDAAGAWRALEAAGAVPAGLGARDSLRLEMAYALYGNDIDDGTSPLEAGLGWLVKWGKGDFVGRPALARQKEDGLKRRLRGIRLEKRGFPRAGYDVKWNGAVAGEVRSGTLSPTLGCGIALAYLPAEAALGDEVEIVIRGRGVEGTIMRPPFFAGGSLARGG